MTSPSISMASSLAFTDTSSFRLAMRSFLGYATMIAPVGAGPGRGALPSTP